MSSGNGSLRSAADFDLNFRKFLAFVSEFGIVQFIHPKVVEVIFYFSGEDSAVPNYV